MMNKLKGLVVEEQGQGMTEYALILGVLAIGVVAVLITLGDTIVAKFQEVVANLNGTASGS
ncbi:Flp family type IVb pilin [Aquibacillus halophilus]|uniref:Flp family type IVb pilin n=1 Tax=Aquibacillus halophilus TaxID=930132 RepID=A0A6A8DFD6_9BACI|nr:Flp family type IVb pilin [Aquibacillus halophilus]MRH44324.1 Flp family type IVb pilin [Aquibacillus halophilus]